MDERRQRSAQGGVVSDHQEPAHQCRLYPYDLERAYAIHAIDDAIAELRMLPRSFPDLSVPWLNRQVENLEDVKRRIESW